GMAIALLLRGSRTLQRLGDGAAHDELPAEDAHGGGHGLAYHRLAGARHHALQYASQVAHVALTPDEPARQHQRPCGCVDAERVLMPEMLRPVGGPERVADQAIDGLGVGNAQERLGETHEHDALLGGERVLVQEGVEATFAEALPTPLDDEAARTLGDAV